MTFPSSRPPALALALVALALAVLITAVGLLLLGIGPFAPNVQPSNAPTRPTIQASVGASITASIPTTQPPSNGPTGIPTGSPPVTLPPASPSSATDALLAHIPEAVRGSCVPDGFEAPVLAAVSCSAAEGGIAVVYALYADQPSTAAVYDAAVISAGIDDNSGRCYNRDDAGAITATTSRWPSEDGYTIQDEPVGRYLCRDDGTISTIMWTDDRLYILAMASTDKAHVDALLSFWIDEAGPIP